MIMVCCIYKMDILCIFFYNRFITKKKKIFKYPLLKMEYFFLLNPSLRMSGLSFFKYKNCSKIITFIFNRAANFLNIHNEKISTTRIKDNLKNNIKNFLNFLNYFLKKEFFVLSYCKNNFSSIKFEKLFSFIVFNITLFKKIMKIVIGGTFFLIINFFPLKKIRFNLLQCCIFEKAFSLYLNFDIIFLLNNKKTKLLIFQNLKKKNIFFLIRIINIINIPCFLTSFNLCWKNMIRYFPDYNIFLKYLYKHLLNY
ncbi:hypothetical protein M951_chr277 (nucleomorph) [Lotharella oceanica]|uniref:Uncharacterized protein n=1 Tax=Lotharella oceanica TaxID=641309 RepID=A0A060DG66_9EUKA|nr:hypothetical protein M951_chr277 [Lotharella oceanica]